MRRTKSTARRSRMVVTSSSSSKDAISLGACQEEAPAPSTGSVSYSISLRINIKQNYWQNIWGTHK
jgi:hypothetical protein